MKFKSDIEVQAGLKDNSDSSGASGQVLSSTANGVSWISPDTLSSESSEKTHIPVKNTSGATIAKGTPVYITGETGNSGKIEIAPADASDSAKMPAVGILEVALTNNSEGFCISGGLLEGLATDTIDGTTTTANDTVYVKAGGGLTMTKPTGSDNLIQNVAKIARTHASNGSLVVSSILRTNDVPNLPEGRIWVGDGNTIVSDTVYVDEPNNRVGIGTNSPQAKLDVDGDTFLASRHIKISGTGINTYFTAATHDSSGTEGLLNKLSIKSVGTFFDHGALAITNTTVAEPLDTTIVQETISSGDTDWNVLTLPKESGTFALENWVTSNFAPSTGGSYLPLTGGTMTGAINAGGGLYYVGDSNMGFVPYPIGAQYRSDSSADTGYILIKLPTDVGPTPDDMVSFHVDVYDYTTNEMISVFIGGYIYTTTATSSSYWYNCTAIINTKLTTKDFTVRFGNDGTNFYVAIGETNSVWSHPSIVVRDFQCSFRGNVEHYIDGWAISTETTTLTGVDETQTGNFPQAKHATTATTAITQTAGDNSTLIATTAYADAAAAAVDPSGVYLPLAGGTLTGGLVGTSANFGDGVKSSDGFFNNISGIRLLYPKGGSNNALGNSGTTGAIKITLPVSWTSTMMRMTIKVYEYTTNESFTLHCGGYNYGTSGTWLSEFAYIESQADVDRNFTIRFGHDGSKCCIYIGELTSVWQYPKVFVTDFEAGFNNTIASDWQDGWVISMETTAFGSVTGSFTNTQVNNWQRNGQDVYYGSGTGNVGIGTTSPAAKLHVLGTSSDNATTKAEMLSNSVFSVRPHSTNSGTLAIAQVDDGNSVGMQFTNGSGTSNWDISMQPFGGNVGIGTTSPSTKLYVDNGQSTFNRGNSAGTIATFRGLNASKAVIGTAISYFTSNVGIGETSPSSKLEVRSETATHQLVSLNRAASSTAAMYLGNDSGSNAIISSNNSDLIFGRDQSSTLSEWMRIKKDGNVGIGTTSPDAQLEISNSTTTSGSGGATLRLTRADGTSVAGDPVGTIEFYSTDADGPKTTAYIKSMSEELYGRKGSLAFGTSITNNTDAVEAMRIDSSGDVGIGVTNPDARIHALNSGLAAKFVSSQGTALEVQGGGNSQPIARFKNTAASEKVTISSTGNLGIGTTSPQQKLHIVDTDGANIILNSNTGAENNGIWMTEGGIATPYANGAYVHYDSTNNAFKINTGTTSLTTRFIIERDSGNVGIGTTNPSQLLHVAGNMRLQNQLYDSTNSLGSNGEVLTKVSAGTEWKVPAVNAKMPDNTAPASAANVGTIRYRSTSNTSFVDMSMQTGATTYTWVNIVSNFW